MGKFKRDDMEKCLIKNEKNHTFEWGILLAICGIPISLITNEILGGLPFDLTNIIFFISLLMIPNYNNLIKCKFINLNYNMLYIIVFQIYVIILAVLSGATLFNSGGASIIFTLYVVIFIIFIITRERDIDLKYFTKIMWWSTGIFNLLLFYIVTNKLTNFVNISFSKLHTGGDRLSISNIVFIHLLITLVYSAKTKLSKVLKYIFCIVCIYNMVACARRGLMVGYIIGIFAFLLYKYKGISKRIRIHQLLKSIIGVIVIIGFLFILKEFNFSIFDEIYGYIDKLTRGVFTYFGSDKYGIDIAAQSRNFHFRESLELYFNNSDFLQFFLGRGYNFRQIDIPLLQAFVDMGFIMGLLYFYIQIIIPCKIIFIKKNNSFIFFKLYAIMMMTQNIYSGVPYGYYKYVWLVLLIYEAKSQEKLKKYRNDFKRRV